MKTDSSTPMEISMNRTQKQMTMKMVGRTIHKALWHTAAGAIVLVSIALASEPIPAPKQKKPIALIGGTIHTVSGGVIEKGTVVFDRGKITAVGTNVTIPPDAERIAIEGKHVYPGIIDAYSNMGLVEIGSVRGTIDVSETGTINPNVRAEVAFHPESELIPVARSEGVAITATTPGGGLIAGTSAAMMLDGWTWEDATLKSPLGLVVNWPSMVFTQPQFGPQRPREEWQKQRDEQLKTIRNAFADARAYLQARKAEQQRGVPYHDIDLRWEAMIPVLEGKVPLFVVANELAQIQSAIAWAEQEGVAKNLVIVGGRDAWRVSDQLKAKQIAVIINDIHAANRRWEGYDVVFSLPAALKAAGVKFCISGDYDASNARTIAHHAATAVAYGLSPDDGLKAITLYAAEVLGIADRVGSIDVGKDATLIVTDGDLLQLPTKTERLYIQGKKIDLRDRHKQLYSKYVEKYRQLREQ